MGWKDPSDQYETIPDKGQKKDKKPFNREKVRYVKDPLGESKYAHHINFSDGTQTSQKNDSAVVQPDTLQQQQLSQHPQYHQHPTSQQQYGQHQQYQQQQQQYQQQQHQQQQYQQQQQQYQQQQHYQQQPQSSFRQPKHPQSQCAQHHEQYSQQQAPQEIPQHQQQQQPQQHPHYNVDQHQNGYQNTMTQPQTSDGLHEEQQQQHLAIPPERPPPRQQQQTLQRQQSHDKQQPSHNKQPTLNKQQYQQKPLQKPYPSMLKQHHSTQKQQQLLQQQQQQQQQQNHPTIQSSTSREGKRVGFAGNEVQVLPASPQEPLQSTIARSSSRYAAQPNRFDTSISVHKHYPEPVHNLEHNIQSHPHPVGLSQPNQVYPEYSGYSPYENDNAVPAVTPARVNTLQGTLPQAPSASNTGPPVGAQEGLNPTDFSTLERLGIDTSEKEIRQSEDKKDCCEKCSKPPWWAWLIILLVTGLLAAVLYFILSKYLVPSANIERTTTAFPMTSLHHGISLNMTSRGSIPSQSPAEIVPEQILKFFNVRKQTRTLTSYSANQLPPSVDSVADCLQACLDQSDVCYGVDFERQKLICRLVMVAGYELEIEGNSPHWENYRRTFRATNDDLCYMALVYNYRHTLRSTTRRTQPQTDTSSLRQCRDACLGPFGNGLLDNDYRCTAAAYDKDLRTCLLTDVTYAPETLTSSETSTHVINDGVRCVDGTRAACITKFSLSRDLRPYDLDLGLEQPGVTSVPVCASRCVSLEQTLGSSCTGFVFRYEDEVHCVLYTGDSNQALDEPKNTDFYRRQSADCVSCGSGTSTSFIETLCQGDCVESEFIATVNTAPTGGVPHGRPPTAVCSRQCQEGGSQRKPCYGFTVNTFTNNCTLFYDINYQLDGIGQSLDSIHYRRQFYCDRSTLLSSNFETYKDHTGGSQSNTMRLLQPMDVNTVDACIDRCLGYLVNTNLTCTGVDFDRRTSRCSVFYPMSGSSSSGAGVSSSSSAAAVGALEQAPGIDHYLRKMK